MTPQQVELALRKQRLQFRCADLRAELGRRAAAYEPVFAAGDKVRAGAHWLRRHPEVAVAGVVALLVARPRAAFRWASRGVFAWRAWQRARGWLAERNIGLSL
jgi:hypothetical protein